MQLDFRCITDGPGTPMLDEVFSAYWPAYQRWMRRASALDASAWQGELRAHMPELVDVHGELCERFGGGEEIGRFLSLYNPPRVVRACTQLVIDTDDGPRLLRSYDHHPKLFDGLVLLSRWASRDVLCLTDCLWGSLDGINEDGLCIALAFGGRNAEGHGFSASMICRYVLQTCSTVAEARAALDRLPVYMAYTFVVLDAKGDFVTAFLGPDRDATFVTRRASANHQGGIEWEAYAEFAETAERLECAESLLEKSGGIDRARSAFLEAPLWRTDYAKASGTLYVAEYAPSDRSLTLSWPDQSERLTLDDSGDRWFSAELPGSLDD